MIRKVIPSMIIVLLVASSPAAADIFITPYGSYNIYSGITTEWTLELDTPVYEESLEVSLLDSGFSGGLTIGYKSEDSAMILGLNAESFFGKSDLSYYSDLQYNRSISSSALAVGVYLGALIGGNSESRFRSILGLELGVLMSKDNISLSYTQEGIDEENKPAIYSLTEEKEIESTVPYISFLFTEEFSIIDLLGLSGSVGWRTANTKVDYFVPTAETPSMSGGYAQGYSGFFFRFGVKVEI